MVSTEWKSPSNITQDARYKVVNGGTANKFTNLNAMKTQNTTDWCYCINNNTRKNIQYGTQNKISKTQNRSKYN